jgi:hypothetical protein
MFVLLPLYLATLRTLPQVAASAVEEEEEEEEVVEQWPMKRNCSEE